MTYYYEDPDEYCNEPCPYEGEMDDDGTYAWTWGPFWEKLNMHRISY